MRYLTTLFTVGFSFATVSSCSSKEAISPEPSQDAGVDAPVVNQLDCKSDAYRGTPMVEVSTPSGVKYCMDAHEVTRGQYKEFDAVQHLNLTLQDPRCKGYSYENGPIIPGTEPGGTASPTFSWEPADSPMIFVNFCGATAYCASVGKKLCGKVGKGQNIYQNDVNDVTHPELVIENPEASQWFNACSQGGKTPYATGAQAPSLKECPIAEDALVETLCGGSISPFDQIKGLYGGVDEIEDFCGGFGCAVRGGAQSDLGRSCGKFGTYSILQTSAEVGFRCCAD